MPPRIKVSKEKVLNTAFEMTREEGFNALTARRLAARLDSSTQPIFRAYENMETLKEDLFYKSVDFFSECMAENAGSGEPGYLSMGTAYIDLAKGERHLFELVASVEEHDREEIHEFLQRGDCSELIEGLPDTDDLDPEQKRELLRMMWMFIHGAATQIVCGKAVLDNKQIRAMIKRAYEGFLGVM
ncbi:MAG: hypothetical protein K5770_12620 [Lachnospiraceae bacterium]|nr:hypothetical protein [Lachnospiraceae bacterium]